MNRDEARVWMAQNPDREVIDARGWIWKCTESGLLAVRGEDTCWRDAVAGLMPTATFTIVEPEKPTRSMRLENTIHHWGRDMADDNDLATVIREEIARIADERIAKAKVESKLPGDQWQINAYTRLIPGDA